MDVGKSSSNVALNLFSSGAIKDTIKEGMKDAQDRDKSNIEKSASLMSGINHKTEEGKRELRERASKIDAKVLMQEYALQFQMGVAEMAQGNFSGQGIGGGGSQDKILSILNSIDTNLIGYKGKPFGTLSKEEMQALVGKDGFFGEKETSDRIADFVINGAGDDLNKLLKGREGVERGYKEAEKLWGGKLPDISKKTLEAALKKIDERIEALRGDNKPKLDTQA